MVLINDGDETHFDYQLLRSMRESDSDRVIEILKNENPGELIDSSRSTLLHYAAKYEADNLISYLLSVGCNVDAQNKFGKTPLMLAVEKNNELIVDALLAANSNLYIIDNDGKNVLQLTFGSNHYRCFKIVESCLQVVAEQCGSDNDEIAKKLIEVDCSLYFAMYLKNAAVSKILIDHGLPVNARDYATGKTALHVAVQKSDVENVKLLIECGAKVNVKDQMGRLPIFIPPYTEDGPADIVINSDQDFEILKILLDHGLQVTSLDCRGVMQMINFRNYDKKFIEMLFDYDLDFMSRDAMNNTALHYLARMKSVNFNLLEGKKFDINSRNRNGETALQLAFIHDNENMVDFLLNKGANIDYPNDELLCQFMPVTMTGLCGSRSITISGKENPDFIKAFMRYDDGIKFVLKNQDAIFQYSLENKNNMTEFVLALVAMFNASQTPVSENILEIIRNDAYFTERVFDRYATELEQMKNEIVNDLVTLFKLLTEKQNKIIMYMRNNSVVQSYGELEPNFDANSYYIAVLRKRVANAIRIAKLRAGAEMIFSRMIDINNNTGKDIVEGVFEYLGEKDFNSLLLVPYRR